MVAVSARDLELSPFVYDPQVKRRAQPRVRTGTGVCFLSDQRIIIAQQADVSLTGAFIATQHPDPLGTEAALRIEHNGEAMTIAVAVVRVSFIGGFDGSSAGMGLRFGDLTREQRAFLARFVAARQVTTDVE